MRRISEETLVQLKSLSIKDFAEAMGDRLEKNGRSFMTYRNGGENRPSLAITIDRAKGQIWKDFPSNMSGHDVMSYYAYRVYGDSNLVKSKFVDVVIGACDVAGIPVVYSDGSVQESTKKRCVGEKTQNSDVVQKAADPILDRFYRAVIEKATLNENHRLHLVNQRGMTTEEIKARGYKSCQDNKRNRIMLTKEVMVLCGLPVGIPGFMKLKNDHGVDWVFGGRNGFLVPFRSIENHVVGFQLRVDEPNRIVAKGKVRVHLCDNEVEFRHSETGVFLWKGSREELPRLFEGVGSVDLVLGPKYVWLSGSSNVAMGIMEGTSIGSRNGSPYHAAVPSSVLKRWDAGDHLSDIMNTSTVWWGEGPLKGDICSEYTEQIHLQVAGVSSYTSLLEPTLALKPKEVILAFDADAQSKSDTVGKTVLECVDFAREQLKPHGIKVKIALWSEKHAKGLDDLFSMRFSPNFYEL